MSFLTAVIFKQAISMLETEFVKHAPEIQAELLKEAAVAAQKFMDYVQAKLLALEVPTPPQAG